MERQPLGLERIPQQQWEFYHRVLNAARDSGVPFALGGAFATAAYTGLFRNTKDLDLYTLPDHRERLIAAVAQLGVRDLYFELPYDARWIYRSTLDEDGENFIIDVIWDMANYRAKFEPDWIVDGPTIEIVREGVREKLGVISPEVLIWNKLYILQRQRSDWMDVMNLLYYTGEKLDWEKLVERMGSDAALLRGALSVFQWIAPGKSLQFPESAWTSLNLPPPINADPTPPDIDRWHINLLDSRPWFMPSMTDAEKARM